MQNWNFSIDFLNIFNIKFHGNPSSDSRADTCGETDGRTDVMWLLGAFRNFSNARKTLQFLDHPLHCTVLHVCNLATSLSIPTLPSAYGPARHVYCESVCGGWVPTVSCFNHFFQRVANSPLTIRCHASCNHFAGFLSGLSRNEKLQAWQQYVMAPA